MGQFGVLRIFRYVMYNNNIKDKRTIFMLFDMALQASLVGNILWAVMFVTKEISPKNFWVLIIASVAAGIIASIFDTNKIFSKNSKFKLPKKDAKDAMYISGYIAFIILYIGLSIIMAIKLF